MAVITAAITGTITVITEMGTRVTVPRLTGRPSIELAFRRERSPGTELPPIQELLQRLHEGRPPRPAELSAFNEVQHRDYRVPPMVEPAARRRPS